MRILLVEDEPTLRAQIAGGLQTAGYTVDLSLIHISEPTRH